MTASTWLNTDQQLQPGTEIFRADRCFQLWQYTASHSQTLLRSPKGTDRLGRAHETRLDVLFKPTTVMKVRAAYDDLVIRVATPQEASAIRADAPNADRFGDSRVLLLESGGEIDYIDASAVGWLEDHLDVTEPSGFAGHHPDTPAWALNPLLGVDAGLGGNVATAQQLIDALTSDTPAPLERAQYRYVYVVQISIETAGRPPVFGCGGVFLTRPEAETARDRLATKGDKVWIDDVPIGI